MIEVHVKRIGDWDKVKALVANLGNELRKSQEICLSRFALKTEAIAKTHMSTQDLGWKSLKAATVARKIRRVESENILIATSTYFQSITSWTDNETAYAGVKRDVVNKEGVKVLDIAKLHEFGTKAGGIPARPLWKPTWDEALAWCVKSNSPVDIFMDRIKKYGVK